MKHRSVRSTRSRVVTTFGVILLLVGLGAGVFLTYEGLWTNQVSRQRADQIRRELEEQWSAAGLKPTPLPSPSGATQAQGEAFALLYLPRLRNQVWGLPVLQGTEAAQLDSGIGHFVDSAKPGEYGNFALAGHRATHGEPLAYIDQLRKGDAVYVRTQSTWFTYVLDRDAVLEPSDTWVVSADPKGLTQELGSRQLITLVTCDPRWGNSRRWIWWGHLVRATPAGSPPAAVK